MDTVERGVAFDSKPDAGLGRASSDDGSNEKANADIESGRTTQALGSQNGGSNATQPPPPFKALSILDRFLVVWIILAMALGIILGNLVPSTGPTLQRGEFVGVSIPIAIGLLVMMYPILCKVRYETLHLLFRERMLWKQIGISFVLNWILAPLFMTGLAWAFLPDRRELRDGLIFVGVARCIAMVLIWTDLAGGDGD